MSERIRIKVGGLELEWESEGSLSLDDVKALLRELETLSPVAPARLPVAADPKGASTTNGIEERNNTPPKLYVTSIAAKLDAKGGPDLARAAAAYLQMTEQKESFTREELLETMRKAPMYFKENMRKNLSRIIAGLIPEHLNQIGGNTYSLTASDYRAIEATLA